MQPHFIRATFMKMMHYEFKWLQSKHGPIINNWTTLVLTLESHRLDNNGGDASWKLQWRNQSSCADIWTQTALTRTGNISRLQVIHGPYMNMPQIIGDLCKHKKRVSEETERFKHRQTEHTIKSNKRWRSRAGETEIKDRRQHNRQTCRVKSPSRQTERFTCWFPATRQPKILLLFTFQMLTRNVGVL